MGRTFMIKTDWWRDVLNSTKNYVDQEGLRLTKTQHDDPPTDVFHWPTNYTTIRSWGVNKETKAQQSTGRGYHHRWHPSRWRRCHDPSSHWSTQHMSYIIDRSPKHGRMLWLCWYIRKEIHQTSQTYRPISLFPIMYKVFSSTLLQRMIRTLGLPPTTWESRISSRLFYHRPPTGSKPTAKKKRERKLMSSTSHFALPSSIMKKPSTA